MSSQLVIHWPPLPCQIQQRAVEYRALPEVDDTMQVGRLPLVGRLHGAQMRPRVHFLLLQAVLEPMPPFPEDRESALVRRLASSHDAVQV